MKNFLSLSRSIHLSIYGNNNNKYTERTEEATLITLKMKTEWQEERKKGNGPCRAALLSKKAKKKTDTFHCDIFYDDIIIIMLGT